MSIQDFGMYMSMLMTISDFCINTEHARRKPTGFWY